MKKYVYNFLFPAALLLFFNSCSTVINLANLKYDEKLDLYQYPIDANNSIYPRDENQHVIGSHNIGSFYTQLEEVEFKCDFISIIFIMPTIQFLPKSTTYAFGGKMNTT